jgi:uncharacterized protein
MKQRVKWLPLLLLLALVLTACGGSNTTSRADIVDPADNFYVSDYADVLDSDTESYIRTLNGELENACGGQIVVVTLDFLTTDLDAEQYAYEILNQWGVGSADENNGIVLLLVPGEGKCWLTVGAGLEDALTAGKLETILETYFYDDFDSGNYDDAVYNTVQYLADWLADWYGVTLGSYNGTPANEGGREPVYDGGAREDGSFMFSVIFLLVVICIIVIALSNSARRPRDDGGRVYFFPFFHHHHHRPPRDPHGPHGPGMGGMGSRPGPGPRPGGGAGRSNFGGGPRGGMGGRPGGGSRPGGGGMGRGGGGMGRGGGAGRR